VHSVENSKSIRKKENPKAKMRMGKKGSVSNAKLRGENIWKREGGFGGKKKSL